MTPAKHVFAGERSESRSGKGKERDRKRKSMGDYFSKPPGPEGKCEIYCTIQERVV
jgi:hypothetical protein